MDTKTRALLLSYVRIFGASLLAAYLTLGKSPLDLGADDAKTLLNAGIAAVVLTLVNYFRKGETRFGVHAEDVGMGGDDTLGYGGQVKTTNDAGHGQTDTFALVTLIIIAILVALHVFKIV